MAQPIRSARLELLPGDVAVLASELDGPDALARVLGRHVPREWPPDLYDRDALEFSLVVAQNTPGEDLQWLMYYVVLRKDDVGRATVVGVAGFKGPPEEGEVEIGYSILAAYRRRRIASEAAEALIGHAFGDPRVRMVVAETFPDLVSSIGVLEACGFRVLGPGLDEGTVRFGITRRQWELRLLAAGGGGTT